MSIKSKKVDISGSTATRDKDNIVQQAVTFIRKRYNVEYNIFLNSYTIKDKQDAQIYTKNDLRLLLKSNHINLSYSYLNDILKSKIADFKVTEVVNPVRVYLKSLEEKYEGESHIEKLAAYIHPRKFSGDENADLERFRKYFKKWFVSMVATALGRTKNDVMFVIIQAEGGTGKSGFIEHLTNIPALMEYFKVITKQNYKTNLLKDITRNMLISFDELAALAKKYLNTFKSEISQRKIKQQFAYSTDEVILDRLGSFAGTTNFNQEKGGFIEVNDKGLMRRIFSVENTGAIDWQDYMKNVDVEQMYAEAVMLVISANFDYDFNKEDYKNFENYNRRYLKDFDLSEVVSENFEKGVKGDRFMTPTDMRTELIEANYPEAKLSPEAIGTALSKLGRVSESDRKENERNPVKGYYIKK